MLRELSEYMSFNVSGGSGASAPLYRATTYRQTLAQPGQSRHFRPSRMAQKCIFGFGPKYLPKYRPKQDVVMTQAKSVTGALDQITEA